MNRVVRGVVGVLVAGAAAVGLFAGGASAHVTIDTLGTVEQGSFAKLGFSVPNERDDAGTVKLSVQMPQDHPLTFVSVQPKAGWEISTTMRTLDNPMEVFGTSISEVIDTITWTATGDTQIAPGQFDQFWISAGPMPSDVQELAFPAVQTYSSDEEVAWIEPTPADGEEPEHPAPTVQLVAAAASEGEASGTDANAGADDDDGDGDGTALAVIALIVGAVGVLIGCLGLVTARNARKGTAST